MKFLTFVFIACAPTPAPASFRWFQAFWNNATSWGSEMYLKGPDEGNETCFIASKTICLAKNQKLWKRFYWNVKNIAFYNILQKVWSISRLCSHWNSVNLKYFIFWNNRCCGFEKSRPSLAVTVCFLNRGNKHRRRIGNVEINSSFDKFSTNQIN